MIVTPDQRLRVFISSTLEELADERAAIARAIESLRLTPVLFEIGARPHPPRELYRAYLEQSHVFIGVYWQRYGWTAPGMEVSGLEEELALARDKPCLVYLKVPAPERDPQLTRMIERLQQEGGVSYRKFSSIDELTNLVTNDLAVLISERFDQVVSIGPSESAAREAESPHPEPGLRAFLFTDVVESTARLTREGDIKADLMRRRHFELLRSAITSRGGREVKNVGDGLMVTFATVIDAVAAAVAIQRAVKRHNRRSDDDLGVRIGIQVGEATVDRDDFFGRAVVEARRLCDAATGGQILASDLVRSLSVARSPHAFQ